MEKNTKLIESLYEKTADYGKVSFELIKLKAIDKTSDIVSSFVPRSIVFVFIASFILLINLGLSFWLGEILGEISYGFFVVAAFYGFVGIIIHQFMHKWIKKHIRNYIIKLLLK
ncbi:MAG: hypothetical protein A2X13_06415 [Bacteroidetes bacterium GWC2_33_15]|nr:MAG: hypothetical protein A2X10_09985 [Bacteroidetes bacterium GWA2_33_15]OFX51579.1 MAG: hypothetical protein A2X13_06415 [Bacteroidetes bacterium GWC2_33_15]OFX63352.1 MAG: hypothetical protein A2X15_13950 [Bacteroidetes bacterium GWB2_32_14]OFX68049.1 MAG: hypothetical protein A2X14_08520 [Bacteroidetes bacterium GWD2_33_33]HAN17128.1 hypothetical protein [Bacteroidales bacterium]